MEIPPWSQFDLHVRDWVALRTAARWEKQIAQSLYQKQVPVFLPYLTKVVQYASKQRTSLLPLFPGYVFCSRERFIGNPNIAPNTRQKIAQVITGDLQQDLRSIAMVMKDRQIIQERLFGKVGERVSITGGPLKGYEGIIRGQKPNRHVLILEVRLLGAQLEVELDENQLSRP